MKTGIWMLLFAAIASGAFGAPTNLRNEKAVRERKASLVKSVDPAASVTWRDINDEREQAHSNLVVAIDAINAVDLSTVTNTVFTGDQRTAIKNLKDAVQSLKVAVKNAAQADRDISQALARLIKRLKAEEDIDREQGVK